MTVVDVLECLYLLWLLGSLALLPSHNVLLSFYACHTLYSFFFACICLEFWKLHCAIFKKGGYILRTTNTVSLKTDPRGIFLPSLTSELLFWRNLVDAVLWPLALTKLSTMFCVQIYWMFLPIAYFCLSFESIVSY